MKESCLDYSLMTYHFKEEPMTIVWQCSSQRFRQGSQQHCCTSILYRRFHVYQHVTSFSHMRSALVGKRTTATSFHRQNTGNVFANTLEYWSKYTNILNPTLREDRPVEVWQIVRSVLGLKKRQDELSRSVVCWQTPRALAGDVRWYSLYYCWLHEITSQ